MYSKKLDKLIDNLNSYGIVTFTDNLRKISLKQGIFLEKLINQIPAVTIDLKKVNRTNNNKLFEISIMLNPRRSAVYILLPTEESEIFRILNDIIEISPVSTRPKTLLFFPANFSHCEEKKILTKVWSLKFLDFSTIKVESNYNLTFNTYNPFVNDFYDIKFTNDKDNIFPDKLKNVHGYPLKTRAYNVPPVITTVVKDNKIIKVGGTKFNRIKYIAEKLNFELEYKEYLQNVTGTFEKIIENLESNEINTSPVGFLLSQQFLNKNFIYGNPMNIGKIVVIAPIIKTPKIDVSIETFALLLIFAMILIIFFVLVRALKLNKSYWNIFNIFGMLIGIPMLQPLKRVDRTIFITIAIMSIIFSNDYFSSLANIKQLLVEQDLGTYEDIKQFNLPIYIPNFYADTEHQEGLLFQKIDSIHGCIELLIKTTKAVCISPIAEAEHFSKINLNFQGKPIMKITDLSFRHQFDSYLYEKASPFAEKIEKSVRQVIESGMISVQDSWARSVRFVDSKQSLLLEEDLLTEITSTILSIGCTFAVVAFLCEVLY